MTRQSISFTKPNEDWMKAQIEKEEYSSKSELVNNLIRKEREREKEIELLRAKLIKAENSGFTDMTAQEILTQSKEELRLNGEL